MLVKGGPGKITLCGTLYNAQVRHTLCTVYLIKYDNGFIVLCTFVFVFPAYSGWTWCKHHGICPSRPSDAYMRQLPRQPLVQTMAFRLFAAKSLSEPMLIHCEFNYSFKFESKFNELYSRKWIWKCRSQNVCQKPCPHWIAHYNDAIMSAMTFQITSLTIVYSTVYSGADERKHESSASLAFVRFLDQCERLVN